MQFYSQFICNSGWWIPAWTKKKKLGIVHVFARGLSSNIGKRLRRRCLPRTLGARAPSRWPVAPGALFEKPLFERPFLTFDCVGSIVRILAKCIGEEEGTLERNLARDALLEVKNLPSSSVDAINCLI